MAIAKGTIDLPLAVADGFQNIPSMYGEKVRNYGEIRGWKSGTKNGLKVWFFITTPMSSITD
jgi:sterol 3beta-glucosyltransferase